MSLHHYATGVRLRTVFGGVSSIAWPSNEPAFGGRDASQLCLAAWAVQETASDLQGSQSAPRGSPFGSPSALSDPFKAPRTPSDLRKRAPPGIRTQNLRSLNA
jgi:hypothetical protein